MSISLEQQIIDTYYSDYQFFFSKPNVVGIAYGYKRTNGIITNEPSIHVYVSKKVSLNYLPPNGVIPALYKDIKTDVIKTGEFTSGILKNDNYISSLLSSSYLKRVRPIQPGYCMSVYYKQQSYYTTGTLGYIVTDNDKVSQTYCLLSINRTFSDFNNAPIGTEIIQPSADFGGVAPRDTVAKLLKFCPLIIIDTSPEPPPFTEFNTVDGSVASLLQQQTPALINPFIPPKNIIPTGISTTSRLLQSVQWTSCLYGNHRGTILATSGLIKVFVSPGKVAWFKDVILVNETIPWTDLPDAGALVCSLDNKALGLLSALSSIQTAKDIQIFNVICPIQPILEALNITLLTI